MGQKHYRIGGHLMEVQGDELCAAVEALQGFAPFAVEANGEEPQLCFAVADRVEAFTKVIYELEHEGVVTRFGHTAEGLRLSMQPTDDAALDLLYRPADRVTYLTGNLAARLLRFALWIGYGLMTLPYRTVAIHSSCIVYDGRAVLFLGESGTGKSTHTRLWREHIEGAMLLNDDSPVIRFEEGCVYAYGSPWSGKTPCYRAERYELKACVRLSQAPYNRISKLSLLQAYGAIHPSCPPEFAYDESLYDLMSQTIGEILQRVPCYHMACLPDGEAARMTWKAVFGGKSEE